MSLVWPPPSYDPAKLEHQRLQREYSSSSTELTPPQTSRLFLLPYLSRYRLRPPLHELRPHNSLKGRSPEECAEAAAALSTCL